MPPPRISLSSDYDRARLCETLSKAGLLQKIKGLPKKENTAMGKELDDAGMEFSGGEGQRVELCRVLYKNPAAVILDEPTASLDPFKECKLYKMMKDYTEELCSIFISHRLASTRFTDKIAVLKDGRIAEYGIFDELMEIENGAFCEFFEMQSTYYRR